MERETEDWGPDAESDGVDEGGKEVGMGGTEVVRSTEVDGWGYMDVVDTMLTPSVKNTMYDCTIILLNYMYMYM